MFECGYVGMVIQVLQRVWLESEPTARAQLQPVCHKERCIFTNVTVYDTSPLCIIYKIAPLTGRLATEDQSLHFFVKKKKGDDAPNVLRRAFLDVKSMDSHPVNLKPCRAYLKG